MRSHDANIRLGAAGAREEGLGGLDWGRAAFLVLSRASNKRDWGYAHIPYHEAVASLEPADQAAVRRRTQLGW